MADFNHELLEVATIQFAFVPVDMQTAINGVNWFNMAMCDRVLCILFKGAGTAGDNPVLTFAQATDNAGTASKALSTVTRYSTQLGAIATAANQIRTIVTQAAGSTVTPTSAASVGWIGVEIRATDLDTNNGFNHLQFNVADVGTNAQLGTGIYIGYPVRQPQSVIASPMN